jgi:hypothetical protein
VKIKRREGTRIWINWNTCSMIKMVGLTKLQKLVKLSSVANSTNWCLLLLDIYLIEYDLDVIKCPQISIIDGTTSHVQTSNKKKNQWRPRHSTYWWLMVFADPSEFMFIKTWILFLYIYFN